MKVIIVLAMHGSPPNDFPKEELTEFFGLHARLGHVHGHVQEGLKSRYNELEAKIRAWPRTQQNDPFWKGAQEMAKKLKEENGYEMIMGFNEFCTPKIEEAIEQAVELGPEKIIVITPMMTRGGEHAEKEIPEIVEESQKKYPSVNICYAWPYDVTEVAGFLTSQVMKHIRTFR